MLITPKEGFDWSRVNWGGPEQRRTRCCSYCAKPFPGREEDPYALLALYAKDGSCAEFCDDCQREWFGVESFDDDDDDDEEEEEQVQ